MEPPIRLSSITERDGKSDGEVGPTKQLQRRWSAVGVEMDDRVARVRPPSALRKKSTVMGLS